MNMYRVSYHGSSHEKAKDTNDAIDAAADTLRKSGADPDDFEFEAELIEEGIDKPHFVCPRCDKTSPFLMVKKTTHDDGKLDADGEECMEDDNDVEIQYICPECCLTISRDLDDVKKYIVEGGN